MGLSKIEKREQSVQYFWNEIQNYIVGRIPVVGPELNFLFNARQNIKRQRLEDFFESFRNEMEKVHGKALDSSEITDEDFIDVMEAIMIQIQSTKSTYKAERFRNILIKQLIDKPTDYQLTLKYVELVSSLSDIEMLILSFITEMNNYQTFCTMKDICNKLAENEREEDEIVINNNEIHVRIANSEITITPFDVEFYVGELINKGLIHRRELMVERRPNLISNWGKDFIFRTEPTTILSGETVCIAYPITGFGYFFIDFIKSHNADISSSSAE